MLELKNINKTYKTSKGVQTHALKDVNLCFPKKGMVFILGKSGSGKSTLLNVIGGLDQADTGEIIINGKSSKDFSKSDYDAYRNTYIGFIFQEFYLMDEYTIEKNIGLALQLQQKEENHDKIAALLTTLGLEGYANRYPNELSGGQKQRVAIARALVKEPEILMADEPTGALDSTTGKEIFDTLKELSKEKLVIVVSHDKESAHAYGDRIIEFKDGLIDSDSAPDVSETGDEFRAIKSHLPFKDSFKLGFSCLGHKKIRMVFTILLTSFALLTLALSDAVGSFNAANAQYKAMNDHNQTLMGIRYQNVDKDGNVYQSYGSMNPISEEEAVKLMNDNSESFARVYDSNDRMMNLSSMGVGIADLDVYDQSVERYYITEMNDFKDLQITDVVGTYPSSYEQTAISSFLADVIIKNGIVDEKGNMVFPKTYEDVIKDVKIPFEDKWLSVTGITKMDLSAYEGIKGLQQAQLDSEHAKIYRTLYSIANKACDKLYVKDGFIESLKIAKSNSLMTSSGNITFEKQDDYQLGTGFVKYPVESFQYYDGTSIQTTDSIAKNEVILSIDDLSMIYSMNGGIYDNSFQAKAEDERQAEIEKMAKQLIGKTITLKYQQFYNADDYLIDAPVVVKGVIWPETFSDNDIFGTVNGSMVSKELIEPYIVDAYYIGELLTSAEGSSAQNLLNKYTIDDKYAANTFVSNDVQMIKSFASFATTVFLIASIAFFIFAALLMMNFIIVSISYRKKDIGILRAIGARSMDVLKIFVWEGVTLAAIAYVLTWVGLEALAYVVNNFAMNEIGILLSPIIITLRQPILLLLIVAAVTIIACAIPVTKIARQRPIDAIKK